MPWTLQHASTTQSLAAWGLSNVTLSSTNHSVGVMTASLPGDMLASVPWVYRDPVILRRGSDVVWRGVTLPPTRSGSGAEESVVVRFADPAWWFDQAIYSQEAWDAVEEAAVETSRVALFASIEAGVGWEPMSVGAQIAAIIAHCDAVHGGGKMQLGSITGAGFAVTPVPVRENNVTHAAALKAALRWVPDAASFWDHSTSPPSLHFVQRADATAREYALVNDVTVEQEVTSKVDQQVRGVRLVYQYTDPLGNTATIVDQAGETSGAGILAATVDLDHGGGGGGGGGATVPDFTPAQTLKYEVQTEVIDPDSAAWWFKYGNTGAATEADIFVGDGEGGFPVGRLSGFSRVFIAGSVPKFIEGSRIGPGEVRGYLTIRRTDTGADGVTIETRERRYVRVLLTTTSLTDGEHTILLAPSSGSGTPEAVTPAVNGGFALSTFVPGDLAASLLASYGPAQYEGTLRTVESECGQAARCGDVVNIAGGLAEWATMKAQVQAVEWELDSGSTRLTLGAAEHLAPQDFFELMSVSRVAPAIDIGKQAQGVVGTTGSQVTQPIMVNPESTLVTDFRFLTSWTLEAADGKKMGVDAEAATTTLENEDGEKTVTAAEGVEVTNTSGDKATVGAQSVKVSASSEDRTEVFADLARVVASSGDKVEIRGSGITITDTLGATVEITPSGITITKDGKTTTLSLLQLLHSGDGKTMSITEDQVIGADASGSVVMDTAEGVRHTVGGQEATLDKTGLAVSDGDDSAEVTAAGGLVVTDGTKTGTLKADELQLVSGDDIAEVTAEGGFVVTDSVVTVTMNSSELRLVGDGKTTTVTTVPGQTIEMRPADVCEDGVSLSTHVLMAEPAAP
jgi:hypothetical protein